MQTITTLEPLRSSVDELRESGRIALVPTMGALHQGHLTLIREAAKLADHVAASIFVNPRQFGPNEDLGAYPRQLAEDSAKLEAEGVALLWAPDVKVMYPQGYATNISVAGVSEGLCGGDRPGHFDGVATVVCKLFNQVRPDIALFGEKDWQQLAVIRRMARDLDLVLPHADAIHGVPTVREADGLAMSSRNAYLSPEQRTLAAEFPASLRHAIGMMLNGSEILLAKAVAEDDLQLAGVRVDYIEVVDAETLEPLEQLGERPARIVAAVRIGGTRLIDNMSVSGTGRANPVE